MFAQVVVDVPHVETDKAFDYQVPAALADWIEIGSRVAVPFGNRLIQGFVIGFQQETRVQRVRDIEDVLDLTPPLTEELVHLGIWLSERYICRKYTALQAMLPAALRSQYKKQVRLTALGREQRFLLPSEQEVFAAIDRLGSADFNQLLKQFPEEKKFLLKAIRIGWVEASYVVQDRAKPKLLTYVKKAVPDCQIEEAMATLPRQASRQKEILQYMLERTEPVPLATLLADLQISYSSVKSLAKKGWLATEEVEKRRNPFAGRMFEDQGTVSFTPDQQEVLKQISASLSKGISASYLLHGVTGSGKTEIYLESIARCLELGREAIVLVPEISLTPQMVDRFKGRFGDRVAVLHSRLSHGERLDEWRMIREGKVDVVVGARSAIFAPFSRLGLIIIDEEHESSYKQEESPRYHAREVALKRAAYHQAVAVFGSATPSLESYHKAARQEMTLLSMPERVGNRPLPPVDIVDMREELRKGNRSMFSEKLAEGIQRRLESGEQMVLFLNRRGFSTFVMCRSCGHSLQCPHCDISLTYHRYNQTVRCHYCGYAEKEPRECPACGSPHIRHFGTGTQKVEEELSRHFPGIRVIRMDVDTTAQKGSHEKWLTMFRKGQGDVLLGTQMIAKGLDFPRVTLVGVIAADTILGLPDFRSAEKTFQLLTQVGGRAGRHQLPGQVIIQTYNPDHYSIQLAKSHDYQGFFAVEAKHRFEKGYPPFLQLILFTFSSENVPLVVKKADEWAKKLRRILPSSVFLLGPVASPIPRIKDRYRFQCLIKYKQEEGVLPLIKEMAADFRSQNKHEDIQLTIDVDPQVLM